VGGIGERFSAGDGGGGKSPSRKGKKEKGPGTWGRRWVYDMRENLYAIQERRQLVKGSLSCRKREKPKKTSSTRRSGVPEKKEKSNGTITDCWKEREDTEPRTPYLQQRSPPCGLVEATPSLPQRGTRAAQQVERVLAEGERGRGTPILWEKEGCLLLLTDATRKEELTLCHQW